MRKNLTTEEFIEKANLVHNNFYDYSKAVYTNSKSKVIIICKKHGEFKQTANNHLNGQGCLKCKLEKQSKNNSLTTEEFIKKANLVHNNYYDYSKTVYVNGRKKVIIICPVHGEFKQMAYYHLNGNGCSLCGIEKTIQIHKKTTEEFINEAKLVHNNYYDYSKTVYKTNHDCVKIICPKHGEFKQIALHHLKGCGCPKCSASKGEKSIINYLILNGYNFKTQKSFKSLKDKNLLYYDFFLPEENLLIEYNGLQHYKPIEHFGGKEKFKIQKKHDKMKKKYAKKNNINLLIIKYNQDVNIVLDKKLKRGNKNENK